MTFNRSAPLNEQVVSLLGTEARRWIKTLPSDRQEWLKGCGPREALPEWLLDMRPGGDFIPIADQISSFADAHLPAGISRVMKGAMGDSMYVIAAARLIPSAQPLRDQLLPLLGNVWGALNDNDHLAALLALPAILGLAGQARQMLDSVDRPAVRGRKEGPTEIGVAYRRAATDIIRRCDDGIENPGDVINEWEEALDRPELQPGSVKTQIRAAILVERKRRSNGDQMICADSDGA